jgi:two-component system NtrC family response regulator
MKQPRILLVDDDRNFLRVLSYHIREFGYDAVPCSSGSEALQYLQDQRFDVVVTDLKMPEMDGLQLLSRLQKNVPDVPVIILTAHGTIDRAVEAVRNGAHDFLTKPFEKEEIRHSIENAMKMAGLVEENRRLCEAVRGQFEFEGLVGSSKSFRDVLDLAHQLALVDTTVLIQGESGTGKEILARAIHYNGRRAGKPFVVVNCGAIPMDLIESELFGYRKGAFTGAVSNKKGKFEAADSGTVFLDEVGELPTSMQVKLLRVLQEREIDVVGDPHPQPVDVRILAATNRNLVEAIRDGSFREDLYYRLSVAPLLMPPLRARKDDIPLLAHHFLSRLQQKLSKTTEFDEPALQVLQAYHWPGNVRELENIVERSVVFDRRGRVTLDDLPAHLKQARRVSAKALIQLPEEDFSLEDLEREILVAALEKHGGNQTHAARYLGMTRNTLIYRMQKYDIREPRKRSDSVQ